MIVMGNLSPHIGEEQTLHKRLQVNLSLEGMDNIKKVHSHEYHVLWILEAQTE